MLSRPTPNMKEVLITYILNPLLSKKASMSDGAARFGTPKRAIDRAWLPEGVGVKEVRGTSCPRDGVSTTFCPKREDANCLDGTTMRLDRHAGRVARGVVKLLVRGRLLRRRARGVDIMIDAEKSTEKGCYRI
jgi:hypothetical protein